MKKLKTVVICTLCLLFLQACSSTGGARAPVVNTISGKTDNTSISKSEQIRKASLIKEYHQWKGTPYRLGGQSKSGVDCSALVQQVFNSSLSKKIPRTTKQQVSTGSYVKRKHLEVGDLVFFKTSWKVRHVGIYIGNGEFFHASTSRGVMISRLDNVYWQDKYWQARRLH